MKTLNSPYWEDTLKKINIVNETKKENEGTCDIWTKKFINDQGLALHKSRMCDKKKKSMDLIYQCDASEGKFQIETLLTEHIKKFHKFCLDRKYKESA